MTIIGRIIHAIAFFLESLSSFELPLRWLRSLIPVVYWCKLPGVHSLVAIMHPE